jgi:hypothetical protein
MSAEPKGRLAIGLSTSLVYVSHERSVLVVYGMNAEEGKSLPRNSLHASS